MLGAIAIVRAFPLSLAQSLYSHLPLIPLVSGFLIWRRDAGTVGAPALLPAGVLTAVASAAGLGSLAVADARLRLILQMLALWLGFLAWTFGTRGAGFVRAHAFALGFLVFLVPFPVGWEEAIEAALQHGSASAAYAMFSIVDTPVLRQELTFHLPGITLHVAPECSGIRSSFALLITSIVAGYLYLKSPWHRLLLAVVVAPLALLRNGFRVFVIGELCVQVSPEMIHSVIHRHGGPLFFALSLVPFGGVLFALVRRERRA